MRFFKRDDHRNAPLLSAAEEAALFQRLRAGDAAAKGLLIDANARLVTQIAKTYRREALRHGLTPEDLIQIGSGGLTRAIDRFAPEKGYRFSTYATHHVRRAIRRAIDARSGASSPASLRSGFLKSVDETRARLLRESGREPTLEETAAALRLDPRGLRAFLEGGDGWDEDE